MSTTPSYPVSAIAKLFDLTERRVQQLASEGVIPKSIKGKYELVPTVKGYINYLRERSIGKDQAPSDASTARIRLLTLQANKLEIENAILNKQFLSVEYVKNTWFSMIARCRAILLAMPSKLANQVIGLNEAREAEELIKASVYEALEELATDDIVADIVKEAELNNNLDNNNNESNENDNGKDDENESDNGDDNDNDNSTS